MSENSVQILFAEGCGCAAAPIHACKPQTLFFCNIRCKGQFLYKFFNIIGNKIFRLFRIHGMGNEGAITASGGAKRNTDIQTEGFIPRFFNHFQLRFCNIKGKLCFLGRNLVGVYKPIFCVFFTVKRKPFYHKF